MPDKQQQAHLNKTKSRVIERAYTCIKKHPELGRIYKKDLIPLEHSESNGLVRTALVKDKYSGRIIWTGETSDSYNNAYVEEYSKYRF